MILHKNPQYFFQKIHNFIKNGLILISRVLGFTCIQWNSELNLQYKNNGKLQGKVVMIFSIICCFLAAYLDAIAVRVIYRHKIDLVLNILANITSIVVSLISATLPVIKRNELIEAYQTARVLGKSLIPFKTDPLMDKKFLRKVFVKIIIDTLAYLNFTALIVLGFYFDFIFTLTSSFLGMLRILIVLPQIVLIFFPLIISLVTFTFAAHLIKIISIETLKITKRIRELYESGEICLSNAKLMMNCCQMSDDLEFLSEHYCKVMNFANSMIKILQEYLLSFCLYIFLLFVSQATSVYSDVFGDKMRGNAIQSSFFLLSLSMLHFLTYGPQKILKRSKKLQEIINSLLIEETEPRLDRSVRK